MKKFKDILKEFREKIEPNRDRGGDDPHERLEQFMEKTPFTHVLNGEHTLHFGSSLDAARLVADRREDHEHGMRHASNVRDERMLEYFGASTGTHDDVMDSLEDHIKNHPNLPADLKPHVQSKFQDIESRAKSRANSMNFMAAIANPTSKSPNQIGKIVYDKHNTREQSARHPNLLDDEHHLQGLIGMVREDPDRGYFLRKEEYKD
jgi:hypothetical protein